MLASGSNKGLLQDIAVVELHIHPGINAVGTAWLGVNAKEPTGSALGMIAYSRVYWQRHGALSGW